MSLLIYTPIQFILNKLCSYILWDVVCTDGQEREERQGWRRERFRCSVGQLVANSHMYRDAMMADGDYGRTKMSTHWKGQDWP